MGVVVRQSVITSIISYLGVIVGYINLLYLYPKFLQADQIGLLRTLQDAALLMAPFAQFGLAYSILKFFPGLSKGPDKGNSFISFTLLLSIVAYGLFLITFILLKEPILSFFKDNASELLNYTSLILWLTFLVMIITLMEYYSRSLLKIIFPNLLREIGLRLMQMILVFLYYQKIIDFHQFLVLSVGTYLVSLLLLVGYLMIFAGFRLNFNFKIITREKFKELIAFSTLNFVGTSASIIISKIDSLMVSAMKGLSSNAIYTTAYYMATVIEIPRRAILQSSTTIIAKAFEENNMAEVQRIYHKTALNQTLIGTLLLIGVWANLHNIFEIMPKGEFYEAGATVVLLIGASKLIDMIFGPSTEIIVLSKHYWFNIVVISVLALSGLTLNYILIPIFGISGAALATLISIILFNIIKYVYILAKLKVQPFNFSFIKVLGVCVVCIIVNVLLPNLTNPYVDILYRSSILSILFVGLALQLKISEEVESIFRKGLAMLRGK